MTTKVVEVKNLKVGKFVVINGEPCKILSYQTSKTGKHGHAKARIDAMGILDNQKRSIVSPVESKIEIPIVERKPAQIIAFMGDQVQLMDLKTYQTYEVPKPDPAEIEGTMIEGGEVEIMDVMGRTKIIRVR